MKIVWRISVSSLMPTYKEQQILDKVCKVTRQKQIKYYDFIPFFDFQYEKIIFNCQPCHFSPCSAVPETWHHTIQVFAGWSWHVQRKITRVLVLDLFPTQKKNSNWTMIDTLDPTKRYVSVESGPVLQIMTVLWSLPGVSYLWQDQRQTWGETCRHFATSSLVSPRNDERRRWEIG